MNTVRIIPRIDIKGPNLVKGIHLEGLRVLGNPEEFAQFYYQEGADEIMYQDVVASLYERNGLQDIIRRTSTNIFIPITVGGGIRTIEDIKTTLRAGADKISLNTAAIRNPNLIREASERFGSSTIVVAIEAIKQADGKYLAFVDNGREYTGVNVLEWAQQIQELGAGELLITSVDKEGTGEGYDLELIRQVAASVSIPVIAHGGAGNKQQVGELFKQTTAAATCIASMLHYSSLTKVTTAPADHSKQEGNFDFIKKGKAFNKTEMISISELKSFLNDQSIYCRI
ncbi:MAG: imidazole glycerol phosphate synthase cyclase subunit [Cytophagaceae bacterium]|jgi:cyclase|nr:imidazole glycerol phosphate synthase cyclase subunit [Cytophagaceae bacterium]